MRKITCAVLTVAVALCLTSCEGCVKKIAKKATDIGLGAVEGVSEVIGERGKEVGEKATDAVVSMAKGAAKSLAKQLDNATSVEYLDSFDKNSISGNYDSLNMKLGKMDDVKVEFLGYDKIRRSVNVFAVLPDSEKYLLRLAFFSENGQNLMDKYAVVGRNKTMPEECVRANFSLTDDDIEKLGRTNHVRVSAEKI